MSPRENRAILSASTSAHVTPWPTYARHAPVTAPTYPVPMTVTRIRRTVRHPGEERSRCVASLKYSSWLLRRAHDSALHFLDFCRTRSGSGDVFAARRTQAGGICYLAPK